MLISIKELSLAARFFIKWHLVFCTVHICCCIGVTADFSDNFSCWFYKPIRDFRDRASNTASRVSALARTMTVFIIKFPLFAVLY